MARTRTARKAAPKTAEPKQADFAEASRAVSKARTDEKTVARAIELYDQGVGLPSIAYMMTKEGFKSAQDKELRPQTIRQWLLKAKGVDKLGTRSTAT